MREFNLPAPFLQGVVGIYEGFYVKIKSTLCVYRLSYSYHALWFHQASASYLEMCIMFHVWVATDAKIMPQNLEWRGERPADR